MNNASLVCPACGQPATEALLVVDGLNSAPKHLLYVHLAYPTKGGAIRKSGCYMPTTGIGVPERLRCDVCGGRGTTPRENSAGAPASVLGSGPEQVCVKCGGLGFVR